MASQGDTHAVDSLQKEVHQAKGEQLLEPKGPERPICLSTKLLPSSLSSSAQIWR